LTSSNKSDKSDKIDDSMFKSENVGKSKPRKKQTKKKQNEVPTEESPVGQYVHQNKKRVNNPPVGMVDSKNDIDKLKKRYSYDPRLDPTLQWSTKTENSEFDVDTVSIHIHEKIDPLTILEKTMKRSKEVQKSLFHYYDLPENNLPLREAIEFYKHDQNWSNRLITGDSLLIMNSLLQKEQMENKVQMVYIDPPYGIKYGSNFQPFTNQKNVKDGKDDDLPNDPEMIKAFRDTWELGIHSYLNYLRNRLLLSKKLLASTGSCFVQISDDNLHLVRIIMDEIFGPENFVNIIIFSKTATGLQTSKKLSTKLDYILWYAKDIKNLKYRKLFEKKDPIKSGYNNLELIDGSIRNLTPEEKFNPLKIPKGSKLFTSANMTKPGPGSKFNVKLNGKTYTSGKRWWGTTEDGIKNLITKNRIIETKSTLRFKRYFNDFQYTEKDNLWLGYGGVIGSKYVVETNSKIIENCLLLTTDPGDLVFDPTCGSGTTAYAAEKYGRRWITCDTSRISIALTKQRLMTSLFDFYELSHPNEGINSGFNYKLAAHITMASVANNSPSNNESLFDQPIIDKNSIRISGPFMVEAVPSPTVKSIDVLSENHSNQDKNKLDTQQNWRNELLRTGIRVTKNQKLEFSRVQTHPATKWLHVDAETKEAKPKRVMISFGPEYSPLDQRQVENAIEESRNLIPKPEIIIFAAMHFDPEAAKDIDELNWPGITILKAEMNKDLLTQDLKKKQLTNESFWLVGSPDIECKKQNDGKYIVTVNGFDYYNTQTDEVESGGSSKIVMWELDTDYDGRSLYPQQVFFPMDGKDEGWSKLAKTLKAEINEDLIIKYRGIESIPFEVGMNKRIAVKIIDDRGIESLKIIDLE
jgi:adenine-specific DNA-methyltransferase